MTEFNDNWEARAVDEEIAEERAMLAVGLCPQCGTELEDQDETVERSGCIILTTVRVCPDCGWESEPFYDVE